MNPWNPPTLDPQDIASPEVFDTLQAIADAPPTRILTVQRTEYHSNPDTAQMTYMKLIQTLEEFPVILAYQDMYLSSGNEWIVYSTCEYGAPSTTKRARSLQTAFELAAEAWEEVKP